MAIGEALYDVPAECKTEAEALVWLMSKQMSVVGEREQLAMLHFLEGIAFARTLKTQAV